MMSSTPRSVRRAVSAVHGWASFGGPAEGPGVERDLLVGLLPLLFVTLATWWPLGLPASYVAQAAVPYLLLAGVILRSRPRAFPGVGFGPANRVTLARATLILPVAALALHADALEASGYWWIVGVSTVALLLDGVDGRIARRTRSVSRFGARFDMELDAVLLLALSLLVWLGGKAGPWVLLIGALRYLFVGAGWIWPSLGRELPPSQRRSAVCAAQGVLLVACLGPVVPGAVATVLAAGGLSLLVCSFAADTFWLLRSR